MMLVTVSINGIVPCGSIHIQNVSAVTSKTGNHEYDVRMYDADGRLTKKAKCWHLRQDPWFSLVASAAGALED